MEKRKSATKNLKSSPLPLDFVKMVGEVFFNQFEKDLKRFEKVKPGKSQFDVSGFIYPDEIILVVSLVTEKHLSATTAYASMDFDAKASSPTVQDVLNLCVDGIASIFDHIFSKDHPERLEQLADESLSAFEDIPFEWSAFDVSKKKVFLKVDKTNPVLDRVAEEWLIKNDPKKKEREEREAKETEKLFVTGKKRPEDSDEDSSDDGNDSDPTLH